MLLYTHVLNQSPYRESNSDLPDSTVEIAQNTLARYHQKQARELYRGTRENHYLERRLFM
jgi:hypothetical protein